MEGCPPGPGQAPGRGGAAMDGITGIYAPGDAELVQKAFLATGALQHRGKTGAGIAVGGSRGIHVVKGVGGIGDVLDHEMVHLFQDLAPVAAIGNVGYTKNKVAEKRNAEPVLVRPRKGSPWQVALTFNGRIVGDDELEGEVEDEYAFETSNKAEVLGALLHRCIAKEGVTFEAGRTL